jgi:hypothetical protein
MIASYTASGEVDSQQLPEDSRAILVPSMAMSRCNGLGDCEVTTAVL